MRFRSRKSNILAEPPAVMLTDLAFNLVIFFVVCASTEPESGRKQDVPRSSKDANASTQAAQNVEVILTRTTVTVNGAVTPLNDLPAKLAPMLTGKVRPEDRMVVLKSSRDTPYHKWVRATALIERVGGMVALQLEETSEVVVP